MSTSSLNKTSPPTLPEREILQAIQGIRFGAVEIVIHDSRVKEIRQTHRLRFIGNDASKISSHPITGG